MQRKPGCRGFTLIELLVAITLMGLMTVLSWRGLDGISRSQTRLQQQSDDVLALQASLAQWGADLDAMAAQPGTPSLDWDGRVLRILRRSSAEPGEGLRVVAWTRRSIDGQGQWLRWQSPPLLTRGALELAWQKAQDWAQTPGVDDLAREVRTVALDQWQIFYYRGNAWSNPLSSADKGLLQATPCPAPTTRLRKPPPAARPARVPPRPRPMACAWCWHWRPARRSMAR